MTRRTLTRSDAGNDLLGRELEPRGEVDSRLVAERLASGADVGPRVPDVARARRCVLLLDRLAEDEPDRLGEVVDARRRARGDVENPAARSRRIGRPNRRIHDVADVREVPGLLSIAVDRDRLALVDRGDEEGDDPRVLGERALSRPEDVEVAEHDGLERVVDAREADAVPLGGELGDAVGRDWIGRCGFRGRQVAARAVDGRGGGEDDAAHALVTRGEQHVERAFDVDRAGGEGILHGARDRAERAEVVDDLDAAHRRVNALVRPQLSFDHLGVAGQVGAITRREVVQHAHVVPALDQRVHEVRADEAGPACDEGFHVRHFPRVTVGVL
jgi:hypothetical protein